MDTRTALQTRRSIRCFENREIPREILLDLLELLRYYPSPANTQPLRFLTVTEREVCDRLSRMLKWAGYLPDYHIPPEHLPRAYIVVLGDLMRAKQFQFSAGAAVNQLLLAAHQHGLGSCCLGLPNPSAVGKLLGIDLQRCEPLYAVALGYPAQKSSCTKLTDTCAYTLDWDGNFCVPKYTVNEITVPGV